MLIRKVITMLDQRKRKVLKAVVQDYVMTAEPVGSRTIARRYGLGVSPATIRNEMADLEEMGFLLQPHTSAGRIPSSKGYRFYVDELMSAVPPSRQHLQMVRQLYAEQIREIDALVYNTAKILSQATNCLAVVESPVLANSSLHSIHFLLPRPGRAVMVMMTDEGFVEHRLMNIPPDIDQEDLQRIAAALTHHLRGASIKHLGDSALKALEHELFQYRQVLDLMLEMLTAADDDADTRVVVGGTGNIFKQPEFRNIDRAHGVLSALNERQVIRDLLGTTGGSDRLQVVIGEENPVEAMQECSCVIASYEMDGREIGRVAVIGPTRMYYAHVIALVELVSESLSEVLTRLLG